jgi:2-polyprenyl-3-methyl-5-hydroxy-6-metoxy-1,4-benzoquinol methylase
LPWHGEGRLLDFGCGGGIFLERMAEQGWRVLGLDASASTVERIRTELRLPALVGSLPHPELEPASFDVITMWHSLEHVHQPLDTLRHAFRLLAPGGRLYVATPNLASWAYRWFGKDWFGLDLPRHLTHFTPASLRLMLERAGFQLRERVRMVRHSDWLRSSAKIACRQPDARAWQHWLTRKPVARLVTWLSYLAGKADCMMAIAERP